MDKIKIAAGVKQILEGLGCDLTDHNFNDTPERVAKAYEEIFAQPERVSTAFEESYTDFILVRGHEMYTFCPHHLLPIRMVVSLAYIPDGKVLGLSKLVRIMQQANSGPIMQERFTNDVRWRLEKALEVIPQTSLFREEARKTSYSPGQSGIAILVEGWHGCMQLRGVKSSASTITMATAGLFETDRAMMDRFLLLARKN